MEQEENIWHSEYEIRQFIDMALRWGIDGVYKSRTEQRPYSVFTYKVENARENFEKFSSQLSKKLTQNENWKAIKMDLNSRFLIGINQYIRWYNENKAEFDRFQPYCPYTLMLSVIESTKAEILKYFPELENLTLPPQQTTNENYNIRTKHYVLTYLIECNAKGESFPIGQKKELEKIGNKKMGAGKGNTFYKVFNGIVNKDLNVENNLIEIGGENWREIIKDLSDKPETIETYLQSKKL